LEIRTYLSHSYRQNDRAINEAFWAKLAKKGFAFFIDPPSPFHQTAHLERRMLESSCFVAIVPFRKDTPEFHCSPFMLYEIGLAIQAKRPKLILVDDRIGKDVPLFADLEDEERVRFGRKNIDAISPELEYKLTRLHDRALPQAVVTRTPTRRIGLVKGAGEPAQAAVGEAAIRDAIAVHALSLYPISPHHNHNALLLQKIDQCDAVILGCRKEASIPSWVTACLLVRPVPTIKLVQVKEQEQLPEIALHPLITGTKMDDREPLPEHLLFWRVEEDLQDQLVDVLEKINSPSPALVEPGKGLAYFRSIGRKKAKIFISNSGAQREFAAKFAKSLNEYNIDYFQYKVDIEAGELWKKRIRQELNECDGLIAFIDDAFLKSEWSLKELRTALKRARSEGSNFLFKAYNIGNADVTLLREFNARDLDTNDTEATEKIIDDVDDWLQKDGDETKRTRRRSLIPGGTREWLIDTIRQLPEAMLQALWDELDLSAEDLDMDDLVAAGELQRLLSRRSATRLLEALHRDDTPLAVARSDEHPLIRFCERLESELVDEGRQRIRALMEQIGRIDLDD
jgi:hypothetical protein